MIPRAELVLFDLGGVLIGLGSGVEAMQRLAGLESPEEVWKRWLACEWVRKFECGLCNADDFARGVVTDWSLPITPEDFIDQFRRWPEDVFDGARELLQLVRREARVGCLSNTNAVHWNTYSSTWNLDGCFDVRFLSFEIGLVKPDREMFDHVLEALTIPAEAIVFLDDNQINVDQAARMGFRAHRVRGPGEAHEALVDLEVVRDRRSAG